MTGIQAKIDGGGFFDKYCFPGGLVFDALPGDIRYGDTFEVARAAVRKAYEPHRHVWQSEYENHVNWEFNSEELEEIVSFFASAAGKHYQEGSWRMNAYISTNTEDLAEHIIQEASAIASRRE